MSALPTSEEQVERLTRRVAALEERLGRLESGLGGPSTGEEDPQFIFEESPSAPVRVARWTPPAPRPFPVTELLGWGGVAALVLAAAYLVKLGVDLGWLTPVRQIMLTVLGGLLLVGAGLTLRRADRRYASLLPAGGMSCLFLAVYGAHLYYRLISFPVALASVVAITFGALWLCHHFQSELYAFMAAAGSYSAPLLLDGLRTGVGELALYYTAWSLLFSFFAIWFGRRGIYLVAAYLALIGFDIVWYAQWHGHGDPPWVAAIIFQFLQGVIFAIATVYFTVQHRAPLDRRAAWAHLPPLLLFYVLQYSFLDRYLAEWASWIALASVFLVAGLYWVTRREVDGPLAGGQLLVSVYAAVALFHAGYLEALPGAWQPWAGLAAGVVLALWLVRLRIDLAVHGALVCVLGLIFAINLIRATVEFDLKEVAAGDWLALAYATELYAAFALSCRAGQQRMVRGVLVYGGHLSAMAAAVHLLDSRLMVSLCWAILAVACLALALRLGDRLLAQSSLLVFAFSGVKVFIYDLAGAAPLVRIGSLLVLGISLYLGGWLYRRIPEENTGEPALRSCNMSGS